MRAAVIKAIHEVEVMTVEDPTPGPREVVVEVAACGICGTDLHILEGEFAPTLPIMPGHEFAGTVVAVGSAVRGTQPRRSGSRSILRSTATSATTAGSGATTCASAGARSA